MLSGERASFTDTLLGTTTPTDFAAAMPIALSDTSSDGKLRGGDNNPVLAIIQAYLDGADPMSHAKLAAKAPPMGSVPHHIFQPYGLGDTTAPPATQQDYAVAAALGLVAHDASVMTPDDINKLSEIPAPASGNLMVGGKPITALVREYAADAGKDAHYVVFDLASARADAERFLAGALAGGVPVVGQ